MFLFFLRAVVRPLQSGNVNLAHLKHCLHNPSCFLRIGVAQQFAQRGGDDLPRYAEFVAQPSAGLLFAPFGEFFPQGIYFLLGCTVDKK